MSSEEDEVLNLQPVEPELSPEEEALQRRKRLGPGVASRTRIPPNPVEPSRSELSPARARRGISASRSRAELERAASRPASSAAEVSERAKQKNDLELLNAWEEMTPEMQTNLAKKYVPSQKIGAWLALKAVDRQKKEAVEKAAEATRKAVNAARYDEMKMRQLQNLDATQNMDVPLVQIAQREPQPVRQGLQANPTSSGSYVGRNMAANPDDVVDAGLASASFRGAMAPKSSGTRYPTTQPRVQAADMPRVEYARTTKTASNVDALNKVLGQYQSFIDLGPASNVDSGALYADLQAFQKSGLVAPYKAQVARAIQGVRDKIRQDVAPQRKLEQQRVTEAAGLPLPTAQQYYLGDYGKRQVDFIIPASEANEQRYGRTARTATAQQMAHRYEDQFTGVGAYATPGNQEAVDGFVGHGGYIGRFLGSAAGSAVGRALGVSGLAGPVGNLVSRGENYVLQNVVQPRLGKGAMGRFGSMAIDRYTGSGAYEGGDEQPRRANPAQMVDYVSNLPEEAIRMNNLVDPGSRLSKGPFTIFSAPNETGDVVFKHVEFIQNCISTIPTRDTDYEPPFETVAEIYCNPGLRKFLPMGSRWAQFFQVYKFKQLLFILDPQFTAGNAATSGTHIMAHLENPSAPKYGSNKAMQNSTGAIGASVMTKLVVGVECKESRLALGGQLYIRTGPLNPNVVPSTFDFGKLQVAYSGVNPLNTPADELHAAYVMELSSMRDYTWLPSQIGTGANCTQQGFNSILACQANLCVQPVAGGSAIGFVPSLTTGGCFQFPCASNSPGNNSGPYIRGPPNATPFPLKDWVRVPPTAGSQRTFAGYMGFTGSLNAYRAVVAANCSPEMLVLSRTFMPCPSSPATLTASHVEFHFFAQPYAQFQFTAQALVNMSVAYFTLADTQINLTDELFAGLTWGNLIFECVDGDITCSSALAAMTPFSWQRKGINPNAPNEFTPMTTTGDINTGCGVDVIAGPSGGACTFRVIFDTASHYASSGALLVPLTAGYGNLGQVCGNFSWNFVCVPPTP